MLCQSTRVDTTVMRLRTHNFKSLLLWFLQTSDHISNESGRCLILVARSEEFFKFQFDQSNSCNRVQYILQCGFCSQFKMILF